MTEQAADAHVSTLLRLLRQLDVDPPPALVQLGEDKVRGRETEKRNRLCTNFKAFGTCLYVDSSSTSLERMLTV